jgi:hypothetical protein
MHKAVQVRRGDGVDEDRQPFRLVYRKELPWDSPQYVKSVCRAIIFVNDAEEVLIIVRNLGIGQSVTNGAERIHAKIVNMIAGWPGSMGVVEFAIDLRKVRFFEIYGMKESILFSCDEVKFDWSGKDIRRTAKNPKWEASSLEAILALTGSTLESKELA